MIERANRCFVCGPDNPIGLHLRFSPDGRAIEAEFVPTELHVGYEGIVHGGILAAAMDDAMANLFYFRGQKGLTARMEVRFRRAVRPGQALRVRAWIEEEGPRTITARAEVLCGGDVACAASGTFLRSQIERDSLGQS
ncbi:MAG: PaaI family thioesterase [Armatimonadota bacterium]|nr:PaaI family thioesterase [Armatimonadota bacterium]MDR5696463.1 PaaI family thioesterase [Armatimonadota bacterium]